MVEIQSGPDNADTNCVMVGFAIRLDPAGVNNYKHTHNYTYYLHTGGIYSEGKEN